LPSKVAAVSAITAGELPSGKIWGSDGEGNCRRACGREGGLRAGYGRESDDSEEGIEESHDYLPTFSPGLNIDQREEGPIYISTEWTYLVTEPERRIRRLLLGRTGLIRWPE